MTHESRVGPIYRNARRKHVLLLVKNEFIINNNPWLVMLLPASHTTSALLESRITSYVLKDTFSFIPPTILVANDNVVSSMPATLPLLSNLLKNLEFSQHPITTILASYFLVTATDMIPFVPCQPLAIALGAKLGFMLAFPITAIGQTTAGILAFTAARKAADTNFAKDAMEELNPQALTKLEEFRQLTTVEEQGDGKILLALIGLRLAPFFPFSAGNYLLGGTTAVPLRLFVVATLMGCIASNLLSVTIGAGGAMLFNDGAI